MKVTDVMAQAIELGACKQSGKVTDWKSLVWVFFTPQGREFCKDKNYPSIDMFRSISANVEQYGVYVEKSVNESNRNIALIGKAESVLHYSGVDRAYKVILMHEAKAVIRVSNYAVVRLENIGGKYEIMNDGTGKILI